MKICSKCKIAKVLFDFTKDKNKKDGLKINCIECCKILYNEYRLKNIDKESERGKKYNKERRIIDKVAMSEYKKEYYINNKEYITIQKKEYRTKNKAILHEKRMSNILLRLKEKISNSIRASLKNNGFTKKSRTYQILGCTFEEFKSYLESKFEHWMTWQNSGLYNGELNYGWDIDHIVPISSAKTEEEILKLNHFSNLQPLCSYTNRYVKINKIIFF